MGGSVEGRGNVRPGIDYNSLVDPWANYIVFSSVTSNPVHFVYIEATTRVRIPMVGYTWIENSLIKGKQLFLPKNPG